MTSEIEINNDKGYSIDNVESYYNNECNVVVELRLKGKKRYINFCHATDADIHKKHDRKSQDAFFKILEKQSVKNKYNHYTKTTTTYLYIACYTNCRR